VKKINKILLVDDDQVTNYLNNSVIEKLNLAEEVVMKANGLDAISFIKEVCKPLNQYPDLIFLDLTMPGMDGFEFLQEFEKLCASVKYDIYLVVLSSSNAGEDLIKLRQLGNYYYIQKPLTVDKLLDIHHRFFRDMDFA
jgi:CheY-like chemotaxis protein